ncbi:MAG: hypothetical protein ACI3XE_03870, partial [Eubacteriales bacterium]
SFWKIVGAFRARWKRFLRRLLIPGYGNKGIGWWRDPKKAWYNFWYHRTSVSLPRLLGYKPSFGACFFALIAAAVLNLCLFPVDATKTTVKAHRVRKVRKTHAAHRTKSDQTPERAPKAPSPQRTQNTATRTTGSQPSSAPSAPREKRVPRADTSKETVEPSSTASRGEPSSPESAYLFHDASLSIQVTAPTEPAQPEPDKMQPKSKPKHAQDRYIRKRIKMVCPPGCDGEVLQKLAVGTYFDLVPDPDSPQDKNAVMLTYEGDRIGYLSDEDRLPYAICLRLNRKVYGVITEIHLEVSPPQYEFETWFEEG